MKDYDQVFFHEKKSIHYLASSKPLGFILDESTSCLEVSAGHHKHEYTTGTSWPYIMK
jgi:hypothetical protein